MVFRLSLSLFSQAQADGAGKWLAEGRRVKQLIVNADDLGYTSGVNRAIFHAYQSGIVSSASLLANGPAFADAVEVVRLAPGLDVGCHLNLVEGAPISPFEQIPHLVGPGGRFLGASSLALRLIRGAVPAAELERECTAQLEKLFEAGIQPSHIDSHKHAHLHPRVATSVANVARHFGIGWIRRPFENYRCAHVKGATPMRFAAWVLNCLAPRFERRMTAQGLRMPDFFTGFELTGSWSKPALEETLAGLPTGITELMCHPGYYDEELEASRTRLKRERQAELDIVADGAWRARLEALGISLTGFSGITTAEPARASESPAMAAGAFLSRE